MPAEFSVVLSPLAPTCTPFCADYDEVSMIPGGSYLRLHKRRRTTKNESSGRRRKRDIKTEPSSEHAHADITES